MTKYSLQVLAWQTQMRVTILSDAQLLDRGDCMSSTLDLMNVDAYLAV
jgi:hypothetical protein